MMFMYIDMVYFKGGKEMGVLFGKRASPHPLYPLEGWEQYPAVEIIIPGPHAGLV